MALQSLYEVAAVQLVHDNTHKAPSVDGLLGLALEVNFLCFGCLQLLVTVWFSLVVLLSSLTCPSGFSLLQPMRCYPTTQVVTMNQIARGTSTSIQWPTHIAYASPASHSRRRET